MSDPTRFLNAFAQALSVMTLYPEGHPSRERVIDAAYEEIDELCAEGTLPQFTFLEGEVIFGRQRLRDMRGWEWASRLASAGVGRLEFERRVARDEFEGLLQEILARLTESSVDTSLQRQMRDLGVRFGTVGLDLDPAQAVDAAVTTAGLGLTEEVDTLRWLQTEVAEGRALPMLEAEAVVRSLSIAMRADYGMLLPLLELKEFDQYTTDPFAQRVGAVDGPGRSAGRRPRARFARSAWPACSTTWARPAFRWPCSPNPASSPTTSAGS